MTINFSTNNLADATREQILAGHTQYAPIDDTEYAKKIEQQLRNRNSCKAKGLGNQNSEENGDSQGGPNVSQHPFFLKLDGLPSPFNPDPDANPAVIGEAILNEFKNDSFSKDLSKDALENKLQNKNKLKNQLQNKQEYKQRYQPRMAQQNTPRPRPGM